MAAAYSGTSMNELTQPPESPEEYPNRDSRGAGQALSRLGSSMPFMAPLKQGLGLFLIQAYSPILKPFEVLNLVTNRMFSRLAPGLADKSYELFYKIIPTGLIPKAAGKIGLGGGITNQISKFLTGGLAKTGIKISDEDIKSLTNELGKSLTDIYNPKFLEQFDNFFTRALQGDGVYMEVAEVLIERALANVGGTVTKALSQGISAIEDDTAQAAPTGAKDIPQTTTNPKNRTNAAQKPATDKQAQSFDNNSQPGLLSKLSATGSNILSRINGIFSTKPAPAAA
jgi:hypothetical protein